MPLRERLDRLGNGVVSRQFVAQTGVTTRGVLSGILPAGNAVALGREVVATVVQRDLVGDLIAAVDQSERVADRHIGHLQRDLLEYKSVGGRGGRGAGGARTARGRSD
jgi:hypothetical protein